MRREEMLKSLKAWFRCFHGEAPEPEEILNFVEGYGMRPPAIDDMDKRWAMHSVYINPITNIWEEDFDKDHRVVEAYAKRMKRKPTK